MSGVEFDDRGLQVRAIDGFHDDDPLEQRFDPAGAPIDSKVGLPVVAVRDATMVFDGLGRVVRSAQHVNGADVAVTTTAYDGFITTVQPPAPLLATVSVSDAYGRVLRTVEGEGRTVTNVFDARGLVTATGPESARVTMTYDTAGRMVGRSEANSGTVQLVLDRVGNVTQQTDAVGNVLKMTYDRVGRILKREGQTPGGPMVLLAEWAYDIAPGGEGLLASVTAHEPGGAYTQSVTGYDARGRGLGVTYVLPNGTSYTETTAKFTGLDQPAETVLPGLGSMPAETVTTGGLRGFRTAAADVDGGAKRGRRSTVGVLR